MSGSWLSRALEESRSRGFLGPGSLDGQIQHAEGFAHCWEAERGSPPDWFLDLGSGGGLPGLVLLERWGTPAVLLDSMERRCRFLQEVLSWPGAPAGAEIVHARAEAVAREPSLEGRFDLVTARSFGSPAVTAECAARFMKVGGVLLVSEPPRERSLNRWNHDGLAALGLSDAGRRQFAASYEMLVKDQPTDLRYPRESGRPKKRPLF
ncbi:MAG TPA: RsmG family class I SAM-dependent methyltransferase [Acidimicrobiales bacterium]|nr:RsmG family class I SAM-dependent methyltransferase [Acidimicrobiales bacterium]